MRSLYKKRVHHCKRMGKCDSTPEYCLLSDSPYVILRAAEKGNLDNFKHFYYADQTALGVQDANGRSAVHQAASKNNTNIIEFIYSRNGDLNCQDNEGDTPLHVAVYHEAFETISYLIEVGAMTNVINKKKQAIIHLATELNKIDVLKVLVKHKQKIDINQRGEHGRTALHIAAIYDYDECAKFLLSQLQINPAIPCNHGYYPIHEAAKNASSKTLEVLLQWGEQLGYARDKLLSFFDSDGNVPLHSAVHGGDIKAVEVCLNFGAKISTQQHDMSTPVHLACAQGAIDIVKLMFRMQPEEKLNCLASCDVQQMTPLHCAAMFDHPEIVELLILNGANINVVDREQRSPLLIAAHRGGWRTVHILIRLGADINITDNNLCNVLHLVVMNGGRLHQFAEEVKMVQSENKLLQILNEKDKSGCSPLHYACREGHIRSSENLIMLGACINTKNNNNESALHFAARYGRYNTARHLLDSGKGTFIINESNGEGCTPLHIASKYGHTKLVQLLLNRGALLHRDHNGRNPLHLAAMHGHTTTVDLLLFVHSHLLDQCDKDGNTALHLATIENKANAVNLLLSMKCKLLYNHQDMTAIDYAINYKIRDSALALATHESRGHEIISFKSLKYPCIMLALIAHMPAIFEAVLDTCITRAKCKKDSKSFYIKYNFAVLELCYGGYEYSQASQESDSKEVVPLPALNAMVDYGRVELLAHPLSQKYLQMKWNSYGKYFHITNVLIYSIFLTLITCFIYQLMNHAYRSDHIVNTNVTNEKYDRIAVNDLLYVHISSKMYVCGLVILFYSVTDLMREALHVYQQKYKYILDPVHLATWMLHLSTLFTIAPIIFGYITAMQFSSAAFTIFFSWFNLLLLLQRFDQIGIYVVMFLEIFQTLIKVLIIFSILIIAFGLAFFILLSKGDHMSFRTIPMSLMRTFSMMLGEIDFLGTYVRPFYLPVSDETMFLPFPLAAFLILGLFMVLMPILLMNLLIGLAVGDIESVRRNAHLKRLAMQVILHTEIERKFPKIILRKTYKQEVFEFPNEKKGRLNILDIILRKWLGTPFNDDDGSCCADPDESYILCEITKTKNKLTEISSGLQEQQKMLRLIIQKMEIKSEADDVDEGVTPTELDSTDKDDVLALQKRRRQLISALSINKSTSFFKMSSK